MTLRTDRHSIGRRRSDHAPPSPDQPTPLAGSHLAGSHLAGSQLAGSHLAGSQLAAQHRAGPVLAGSPSGDRTTETVDALLSQTDHRVTGIAGMGASPRPSMLVIGHGSRSEAGVAEYWQLAQVVAAQAPWVEVGCGFIELAKPDLDTAIDALVAAGATSVVASPLILLGAGHLKNDGPAALARGRVRHPGVSFSYARDLGIHPLVLAVAADRIAEATRSDTKEAQLEHSRSGTGLSGGPQVEGHQVDGHQVDGHQVDEDSALAVVLVSRGSSDPDANADLYKVARLLADTQKLGLVEPAFVSLAQPGVPQALDRCRLLGARRVAVVPYFLFTGILVERISVQARAWAAAHPEVQVQVGRHLGPDPRIARLLLDRFGEARGGQSLMNCDMCLYRHPIPGYQDRHLSPPLSHSHEHKHDQGNLHPDPPVHLKGSRQI
ncbi:MAG: sirohydrochlorin chelatase [Acidimicrobiales bacterium]